MEKMMICDFHSGNPVTGVLQRGIRGQTFALARSRLTTSEIEAIQSALDRRIAGSRIETSSWIPGADWLGTPYHPIYEKAARCDDNLAAMMFGLFVWEAFERHPLDWYTERFSWGGEEDRFRVYFRPEE